MKIVLASTSVRRQELIKQISNNVVFVSPDCDENIDASSPSEIVTTLACRKAGAVTADNDAFVVGADTVVALGNQILGKPSDAADAYKMFKLLCGKTHNVLTGVCVMWQGKTLYSFDETKVTFKPYDENIVSSYVENGLSFGKAGAYGIQDRELSPLVEEVNGNVDNVIGLPIKLLKQLIEEIQKK